MFYLLNLESNKSRMKNIKFRTAHFTINHKFSHISYWGTIDHKQEFSEDVFTSPSTNNSAPKKVYDLYSGFKDKNGVEIYENDIVLHPDFNPEYELVITFQDGCFLLSGWDCIRTDFTKAEIIGNTHNK